MKIEEIFRENTIAEKKVDAPTEIISIYQSSQLLAFSVYKSIMCCRNAHCSGQILIPDHKKVVTDKMDRT